MDKRDRIKGLIGDDYQNIIFFGVAIQDKVGKKTEEMLSIIRASFNEKEIDLFNKKYKDITKYDEYLKQKDTFLFKLKSFMADAPPINHAEVLFRSIQIVSSELINKLTLNRLRLDQIKDELVDLIEELEDYIDVATETLDTDELNPSTNMYLKHRVQELQTTKYIASSNILIIEKALISVEPVISTLELISNVNLTLEESDNTLMKHKNTVYNIISLLKEIRKG